MKITEEDLFAIKRNVQQEQASRISASVNLALGESETKRNLALFLVARHQLFKRMTHSGKQVISTNLHFNHRKILLPTIDSSLLPLEREVSDVRYIGDDPDLRTIGLVVNDDDEVLKDEKRAYMERADPKSFQGIGEGFIPHVALARIRPELATIALLKAITSKVPDSITLSPVTTSFPECMPIEMQTTPGIEQQLYGQLGAFTNHDVRELGHIPQGLINSLRLGNSSKELTSTE